MNTWDNTEEEIVAYKGGVAAFLQGVAQDDCPYVQLTLEALAWAYGWFDAWNDEIVEYP